MQPAYLTINDQGISQQLVQVQKDTNQPFIYMQGSSYYGRRSMNQYIHICRENALPIISILYTGKHAKVEMDLVYVPHCHDLLTDAFVEKMMNACELACGGYNSLTYPGVITVAKAPRENAQTLALSFVVIYQQTQGKQVPLPVFEHPAPPGLVRARLELAKGQGYARAKRFADPLPLRYQRWCKSIQAPYICLWTRRADHAEIQATFPKSLSSAQIEVLNRFAEELNIAPLQSKLKGSNPTYIRINPDSLRTVGSWLPGDLATTFIEQVVTLCRQAGMFPSE